MKPNEPWLNRAVREVLRAFLLIGIAAATLAATNSPPDVAALCARALVAEGDLARLHRQFDKARKGETFVVGIIGGSITQGACASAEEKRYGNLVATWWREKFPQATVKLVNAGIGATGSDYGALRAQRDLLSQKPDFVIVEYAVNDSNKQKHAETLEGLLRQILKQPNQPAVLLLFMMHQDGRSAQEWFSKVGSHYRLPMVSYRDPLWAEIQAGRMKWSDISPDVVHPNDRGHAYAARFITHGLGEALKKHTTNDVTASAAPMPEPLLTDLFEHVCLMEAGTLKPLATDGWAYDAKSSSWKSDRPGSTIEFEIEGRAILTMHYLIRGPMGRARVMVDGREVSQLEAWFDQTWGGCRKTQLVTHDLPSGKHRVRFELLPEKHPQSTGHEFHIMGLGAAGN